ncbi:synaptobrevin homolog YKT6-like isoform X2 [Halichondria panicea]|uniref:synaptobrevin homolog YKT6-like isoform X2 n=1 Tax=Halichondria panicea TaxID=6063 RepID=UPI00312B78DA
MVKIFSITILYKSAKPVQKKASYELSSFGFFQRSGVREFMAFTSDILVEKTASGQRQSVKEQDYKCHVHVRSDSLACVVIADNDYPPRVAFTLMSKIMEEFSSDFPRSSWDTPSSDLSYPPLDAHLKRYQDPREADPMMRVQSDLDETKIVLHETIEQLLERGEKLDDLVQKTDKLSGTSKAFYKEAKGGCCVIQ